MSAWTLIELSLNCHPSRVLRCSGDSGSLNEQFSKRTPVDSELKGGCCEELIRVKGRKNIGKSQTIRTAVEMLTTNHPDATFEHNHTTKADMRVVLTINEWKIGIDSQGGSLDLFVNAGCDVIVCATRTSGPTVDAVNALRGFQRQWIEQPEKSRAHEQILRSIAMARQIVERVEALIRSTKPAPARTMSATA